MDTVAGELNRIHQLFLSRNPNFSGRVSLGGHSLGSVILFDLLMNQRNTNEKENVTEKDIAEDSSVEEPDLCIPREDSITSQVDYVVGNAGTGQPSIIYPMINFKPDNLFLMGSPVAMFITVRGIDNIDKSFKLPTCDHVFNIFHPYDPVAYRLETLIDSTLTDLRPVLIPHHQGRKRMHLELKETIERVGNDIKHRIVDSIQSTWSRLYKLYSGTGNLAQEVDQALADQFSSQATMQEHCEVAEVESIEPIGLLNMGGRIDYVLQETPYESFNEYIFALQAHLTYWQSQDTLLLILNKMYGPMGIECNLAPQSFASTSPSDVSSYSSTSANLGTSQYDKSSCIPEVVLPDLPPIQQPVSQVPLFLPITSNQPIGLLPILNHANISYTPSSSHSPRIIGRRPVAEPTMGTIGMDPTASPLQVKNIGPPPIVPNMTLNRSKPLKR